MSDYIERSAVMEVVRDAWAKNLEPTQTLEELPAVDAVEVVRCRECKYFFRCDEPDPFCGLADGLLAAREDSFCSYGERRHGADGETER